MLDRNALLIVIDFQEKMIPHIEEEDIIKNAKKLIKAMKIFKIPIILTKQIKLGETVKEIKDEVDEIEEIEKDTFSCYRNKNFYEKIVKMGRKKCIIIGIETHICVLQTALDLVKDGYEVHVALDCTGSRRKIDKEIAIQKMIKGGVIPSTAEIIMYEMLGSANVKEFKDILKIVKS